MAVDILVEPQPYTPVYNSMVVTVNSSNKTQCNFRYVCDVYVNNVNVASLRLYPTGTNGYADFKINRVVQDYLTYNLQNNLYGFAHNTNSICKVYCKIGEEYDSSVNCDSGTTVFPDLATTQTFYAFNGAMQYEEFRDYTYNDYVPQTTSYQTKKFLTHSPSAPDGVMIREGDQYVLNFLNATSGVVSKATVITYDSSGIAIQIAKITNPYSVIAASDITNRLLSFGCGPDNINNSTLASGSQPVITGSVYRYEVYLENGSAGNVIESKNFIIDRRFSRYPNKRFWFLNRLGGFDAYSFTQLNSRDVSISRNEFHKLMGAFGGSSPNDYWRYEIGNRGRTNISVDAQDKYKSTSNWMTELEALWIEELFTSPEVYLIDTFTPACDWTEWDTAFDARLNPIIITSAAWMEKVKRTTKNISYLIDYDNAYKINIQRN